MFKPLLEKAIEFVKLYEAKKDLDLLINCVEVQEYNDLLVALNKFTIHDLCLDNETLVKSFIPDHITAATIVEAPAISIGYFFIPAGM